MENLNNTEHAAEKLKYVRRLKSIWENQSRISKTGICDAIHKNNWLFYSDLKPWFLESLFEYKTQVLNQKDFYTYSGDKKTGTLDEKKMAYFWKRNVRESRLEFFDYLEKKLYNSLSWEEQNMG